MNHLALGDALRRRLLPLVVATGALLALAAPVAHFLLKRSELLASARSEAGAVAELVRRAVEDRPLLWRYDAARLRERLDAEGHATTRVELRAQGGSDVPLPSRGARAPGRELLVWGRAPVQMGGRVVATVWVAVDGSPLVSGTAWLALVFALLAATAGGVQYWLPMRAITVAERRIRSLLGQLALTLQEQDRRRIARDLHDGAGQALTAARLNLMALRRRAPDGDAATLLRIATHLDDALSEIRRSTTALAPPALAELGLAGAIARQCDTLAEAAGIPVSCELPDELPSLAPHVETACYRMVQEALTNTARHAGATRAWVKLEAGTDLRIEIGDDGVGPSAPSATVSTPTEGERNETIAGPGAAAAEGNSQRDSDGSAAGGTGLAGMRERASLVGGSVSLRERGQGKRGFIVEIRVPLGPVVPS